MARVRTSSRESIIEVARQHFTRYGYKRTVIDEIVRDVGIAKGTFYSHFKSKEELFFEVIESIRVKLMGEFYEGITNEPTAIGKFKFMIRFSLDAMEREPLIANMDSRGVEYRLMFKLGERLHEGHEIEKLVKFIRSVAQEGIEKGELRPDLDLEVLPYLIGSLKFLHFYIDLTTAGMIDREQFVDGIADLVTRGMVHNGGENRQDAAIESGD